MNATVVDDVRRLLSGTSPLSNSAEVEEALANSRSNNFAKEEDIKLCHAEIIHNGIGAPSSSRPPCSESGSYLTDTGALSVSSGAKTGRSPKDKRVVVESESMDNVWWGPVNIQMNHESFMINRERAIDYINTRDRVYVVDGWAGWDKNFRIGVRVVCCRAYHALFMKNMLVDLKEGEQAEFQPDFLILNAGAFPANRYVEGMTSSCSVDLHLGRYSKRFGRTWAEMVILGTQYAGEMKKGILTLMMYRMPLLGQLCLHSSANEDDEGNVTVFFGLSGTGKTTLSADPRRKLIGDDEHVWTADGVFNVEGGCYAKCIGLTEKSEPEIYRAIRFGAVVENVIIDERHARGRLRRHLDHREHALCVSARVHPERKAARARRPPKPCHPAHVRRLRRASARLEAHQGAGHLPLHLRLHLQDGRHRAGHHQAGRRLLRLLRRALPRVASGQVRDDARREAREPLGDGVAPQHRLGRRRRRQALPAQVHARHRRRDPLGRPRKGRVCGRSRLPPLVPDDVPERAKGAPRPERLVGGQGRLRGDAGRAEQPLPDQLCKVREQVLAGGDRAGAR